MNKKTIAIILCLVLAAVATYLGGFQNIVGAPMIGLFMGMLIFNLGPSVDKEFLSGTTFARKKFLRWGIIVAGGTLNFNTVLDVGATSMPLILANIAISFAVAFIIGRKLNLSQNTCTLVGGGTSICGGTAIATLSTIINAKESEIAYAMTALFLFDIFSALLYPYLAGAIGLTVNQFGILAGTSINDTSSVAAAEATYNVLNNIDSSLAITVKLARTTMLVLVSVLVTISVVRKQSKLNVEASEKAKTDGSVEKEMIQPDSIGKTVLRVFPWFVLYFLGMAVLNTFGLFDMVNGLPGILKDGYKFLITAALVGVGFNIDFKDLFTKGVKPIILGGFTWLAVAVSSLLFITIFASYIG